MFIQFTKFITTKVIVMMMIFKKTNALLHCGTEKLGGISRRANFIRVIFLESTGYHTMDLGAMILFFKKESKLLGKLSAVLLLINFVSSLDLLSWCDPKEPADPLERVLKMLAGSMLFVIINFFYEDILPLFKTNRVLSWIERIIIISLILFFFVYFFFANSQLLSRNFNRGREV